jgi:sugar lactone lactonase YvrE
MRLRIAITAALLAGSALVVAPAPAMGSTRLVTGLAGGAGSTIGPDGALYVTEPLAGRVSRVDPTSGRVTTFASGLPVSIIGLGGAMDVAFIGHTAYVLVTLVSPDVGGSNVDGIYRIDGRHSFTIVADVGAYALANPPGTDFFVPTGLQYALEPYRGGLLVTDGHHNRVYRVRLDGRVTELIAFDNVVPTGLEVHGNTIYMAEAGPVPHLPENGKVIAFNPHSLLPETVAAGGRLLVDVERGQGNRLFALGQGVFAVGDPPGSPALPDTGQLFRVNLDGTFTTIADGFDQPTSLEIVRTTPYVVTLGGEIWRVDHIAQPPWGSTP